jgi:hypothetical protein
MQILGSHTSIDEPFGVRPGRRFARLYLDRDTLSRLADRGSARIHVRIDAQGRIGSVRHDVHLRLYER